MTYNSITLEEKMDRNRSVSVHFFFQRYPIRRSPYLYKAAKDWAEQKLSFAQPETSQ